MPTRVLDRLRVGTAHSTVVPSQEPRKTGRLDSPALLAAKDVRPLPCTNGAVHVVEPPRSDGKPFKRLSALLERQRWLISLACLAPRTERQSLAGRSHEVICTI